MSRVELVAVPLTVARAAVTGDDLDGALRAQLLARVHGWPHADTTDALRPLAEYGTSEGTFLVVRRQDRAVLGECGWFGPPDPADLDGSVEIGYGLAASVRRQGLGREAVRLLLEWVSRQPDVHRATAEVLVGNEASLRLLAGAGFQILRREGDRLVLALTTTPP